MIISKIDPQIKVRKLEDLITLPITIIVNKFDEESAKEFRKQFGEASSTNQQVIPVVIDSYGGECYALMSMLGVIKSATSPVATIITGKAMSCGSILFSAGSEGYRFMDPLATVMIHEISSFTFGKVEEVKADAQEVNRLNQLLYNMMAENVGKPKDYFLNLIHEKKHADWYLTAEECLKHNLTNHLHIPSFNINISFNTNFGK
jgi:ATP-dependent Clp protease protease subunit